MPPHNLPKETSRLPAEDIHEIESMDTLRLYSYRFEDVTAGDTSVIQRAITLLDKHRWGFFSLPFHTKWPDAEGTDIPAIAKAFLISCDIAHEVDALIRVSSLVSMYYSHNTSYVSGWTIY